MSRGPGQALARLSLLALAFGGGAVDACSYLGLGRVFTANMTGNTVLLAMAVARGLRMDALHSATALAGFVGGAALAVMLLPPGREAWPGRTRQALLLELFALTGLLIAWTAIGAHAVEYALIALAGTAMGAQSAAVRVSQPRAVNTTYMTSTLLNAVVRVVHLVLGATNARERPGLPWAAWAIYGVGALAGAFAVRSWHGGAIAIPLGIVGAVCLSAWLQPKREEGSR